MPPEVHVVVGMDGHGMPWCRRRRLLNHLALLDAVRGIHPVELGPSTVLCWCPHGGRPCSRPTVVGGLVCPDCDRHEGEGLSWCCCACPGCSSPYAEGLEYLEHNILTSASPASPVYSEDPEEEEVQLEEDAPQGGEEETQGGFDTPPMHARSPTYSPVDSPASD